MPTVIVRGTPQFPIEENLDELLSLIADVGRHSFSFVDELEEIKAINPVMSPDPENGVTELNALYAEVQAYLSRVSSIVINIYVERAQWLKLKHRADRLYRKAKNRLYADSSIRTAKNKEIQEAMIQEQIPELVDIREMIDSVAEDIDMILAIMKSKQELLDKFNTNLSRQQKIVDTLIGLNFPVQHTRGDQQ